MAEFRRTVVAIPNDRSRSLKREIAGDKDALQNVAIPNDRSRSLKHRLYVNLPRDGACCDT